MDVFRHTSVVDLGATMAESVLQMTDKQWDTIIALHNTAPFKLVRAAAPYFRVKDGEPRNIINISSTSGVNGNAGQANYGLAKAGVTGLSKVIAKEWGPSFGVRANTYVLPFTTPVCQQLKRPLFPAVSRSVTSSLDSRLQKKKALL